MSVDLPIHAVSAALLEKLARGPLVVASPTGSAKSTEVPRMAARAHGRVLVVEPRRVACRSLAQRVAELEGTTLGDGVGYVVRDESMVTERTRIVFATPGIVLASRNGGAAPTALPTSSARAPRALLPRRAPHRYR